MEVEVKDLLAKLFKNAISMAEKKTCSVRILRFSASNFLCKAHRFYRPLTIFHKEFACILHLCINTTILYFYIHSYISKNNH